MSSTIGEPSGVGKPWQRGFDLALLRDLARRFAAHDGDRCLGAFSRAKETVVAGWLADGALSETGGALVASRRLRSRAPVRDFRGEVVAVAPAGALAVDRVAGPGPAVAAAIEALAQGSPILWRSWAGHLAEEEAAERLRLERVGSAIRASSEILALRGRGLAEVAGPLDRAELAGIAPLWQAPADLAEQAEGWPELVSRLWVDHYSSYNRRRSWHAVALRSFGGSPDFIEKPAEMSRAYREEHPERLAWPIADTPLLDALPGARALLASLGCDLERVRLMRLSGGGELSRHADITDRAAGVRAGAIARLHLPLVTDPRVLFQSWDLDNRPASAHMAPGCWWYLDVRKPHRAINESGVERVHLVADCRVTPALREAIGAAA